MRGLEAIREYARKVSRSVAITRHLERSAPLRTCRRGKPLHDASHAVLRFTIFTVVPNAVVNCGVRAQRRLPTLVVGARHLLVGACVPDIRA